MQGRGRIQIWTEKENGGEAILSKFETKTAKSFRKKDMPRLMIEKSGQPPIKKVIDSWLTNTKLVMHLRIWIGS